MECAACHTTKPRSAYLKGDPKCKLCSVGWDGKTDTDKCSKCAKGFHPDLWTRNSKNGRVFWNSACSECKMDVNRNSQAKRKATNPERKCEDCGRMTDKFRSNKQQPCELCRSKAKGAVKKKESELIDWELLPRPTQCSEPECPVPAEDLKFVRQLDKARWNPKCNHCTVINKTTGETATQCYRRRQRAENLVEYLEKSAQRQREYRARKPELFAKIRANLRRDPKAVLGCYSRGAKHRSIDFSHSDSDHFAALLMQPCYYCGYEPDLQADEVSKTERCYLRSVYDDV